MQRICFSANGRVGSLPIAGGAVSAIPAYKVEFFRYYDKHENINRIFVARRESDGAVIRTAFYESVIRGWISVFRKPKVEKELLTEKSDFEYFVEWEHQLVSLRKFRSKVYPSLVRKMSWSTDVKSLNPNRRSEALRIIQMYNRNYAAASIAGI